MLKRNASILLGFASVLALAAGAAEAAPKRAASPSAARRAPGPAPSGVSAADFAKVRAELDRQAGLIAAQQAEITELRAQRTDMLAEIRAGADREPPQTHAALLGQAPIATEGPPIIPISAGPEPVGQRPDEPRREVGSVPPELGVLTPKGQFILDPSVEYVRSSNNRLVFRGVEIVPGIQLGVIEASEAARDTGVATLAARYGLTSRLEVEARLPYVWRHDRITTLAQRDDTVTRSSRLDGGDFGDAEFSARYQLNAGRNGFPVFVATSRVKPPTGTGPYSVPYDSFGVASSLATGSGFWGAEGGVTMLYASDPAIIFGGLTYLHNFSRDVNKTIGSGDGAVRVGRVDPGDSIAASLGFGLALNPRFSVSLGYSHNYIFDTTTELNDTKQSSQPLQVGSLLMGWSFRLNEHVTLNNSFEFGVTSDAPDLRIVFRAPYRF